MTPAENPVSQPLSKESGALIESWKTLTGPEFDRACMGAQVKEHQTVLETMDKRLIPGAKNAELKAAIVDFRPEVEAHLEEAQEIQRALAAAPATAPAPAKK